MTWYILQSLNRLYHQGAIPWKESFVEEPEVRNMIHSLGVLHERAREVRSDTGFTSLYETCYLAKYETCRDFLESRNLAKPQTRFEIKDIEKLIEVEEKMRNGDLDVLRQQIIEYRTSLRQVSHMFFKKDKYLEGKDALINALKSILKVDTFSNERDQQYIYKLECHNPKLIVLCENLNFLTQPELARMHHIELWYAGGKNIDKLKYANNRELPIYYSADWDKDGLEIFLLIKKHLPSITILTPTGNPTCITTSEHRSLWQNSNAPSQLSGLATEHFTEAQIALIESLISNNQWVVEESNDLIEMLHAI